jgi:hypothetical protein
MDTIVRRVEDLLANEYDKIEDNWVCIYFNNLGVLRFLLQAATDPEHLTKWPGTLPTRP